MLEKFWISTWKDFDQCAVTFMLLVNQYVITFYCWYIHFCIVLQYGYLIDPPGVDLEDVETAENELQVLEVQRQ